MIKLLALDLDGTVLNSRGEIPEANRIAIREAERCGVLVTIATGRRFRDARPIGQQLDLNAPLITHNGALLKFASTMETVSFSLLQSEVSAEIIRVGREFGGDALLSVDPLGIGVMYYDNISDDNFPLRKYVAWAEALHGEDLGSAVRRVPSLLEILPENDVIHIAFSGGCGPMADLSSVLDQELGDSVKILSTVYPKTDFTLLDILPQGSSKASGLEKLAELNGLTREEIMAIGDNFNDVDMLEYAGTPVIMGNADSALLGRDGFYPTAGCDENGVAEAIRRFILDEC
ncbi:MAG TPA: hypothetical protein DEA22_09420 [Blastocatellia bacterium]|nr:hypothetical protein [Blastocatellia bacterium]